jgi:hypothetical protein
MWPTGAPKYQLPAASSLNGEPGSEPATATVSDAPVPSAVSHHSHAHRLRAAGGTATDGEGHSQTDVAVTVPCCRRDPGRTIGKPPP